MRILSWDRLVAQIVTTPRTDFFCVDDMRGRGGWLATCGREIQYIRYGRQSWGQDELVAENGYSSCLRWLIRVYGDSQLPFLRGQAADFFHLSFFS